MASSCCCHIWLILEIKSIDRNSSVGLGAENSISHFFYVNQNTEIVIANQHKSCSYKSFDNLRLCAEWFVWVTPMHCRYLSERLRSAVFSNFFIPLRHLCRWLHKEFAKNSTSNKTVIPWFQVPLNAPLGFKPAVPKHFGQFLGFLFPSLRRRLPSWHRVGFEPGTLRCCQKCCF